MSSAAYPTPTSPLYQIAVDYMRAANNLDWTKLESLLADGFTQQINPSSIRTPGHEDRVNKAQFISRGKQMLGEHGFIKSINVDIDHPVNVVEGRDCIVLQLSSTGVLASGKAWPMEYVHIIRFDADQKIITVDSWNDSAMAHAALPGAAFPKFGEGGQVANLAEATAAMKAQQ